jgi:hypothetical protein
MFGNYCYLCATEHGTEGCPKLRTRTTHTWVVPMPQVVGWHDADALRAERDALAARLAAVEAERDALTRSQINLEFHVKRRDEIIASLTARLARVREVAAEWVMPDPTWRGGVTDAFNQCAADVLAALEGEG